MKEIYLDYAAATPIDAGVIKAMNQSAKLYANPSSYNDAGRAARKEIDRSRKIIADFLGGRPDEIIFTSSGSEANYLSFAATLAGIKGEVLISAIEHTSVFDTIRKLGLKARIIPVNSAGFVDLKYLQKNLTSKCSLVSVMYANNEIGTIQPIKKIAKMISDFNRQNGTRILFHVDACQAAPFLNMNSGHLGADLITFDGSKLYGPHGIGVLYLKRGTQIVSSRGQSQEKGLKPGTENIQAIVGLAHAIYHLNPGRWSKRLIDLRDYMLNQFYEMEDMRINGPIGAERLPNNINISVKDLTSETLLLELDKYGIRAGSGSACTSYSVEPSHVLKAIGVPEDYLDGSLRFSLGRETTRAEIGYTVRCLKKIIQKLKQRYALIK